MYKFFMPNVSLMGPGCSKALPDEIKSRGFTKALVVCGKRSAASPELKGILDAIEAAGIEYAIYPGSIANPTTAAVMTGVRVLQAEQCDFVMSFGGGSPHDCAKGIALVAANGGDITDYEGVNKSAKPMLPLVAINTTAGTASEMTIFCIITDEVRHVKMAIVDEHANPTLAVNDPELMTSMPASLTAATGMDALTHAIEAYVSTIATPVTDACAQKAIALIEGYLRAAVANGDDMTARDQMSYAEYLAGMAFNNASLGYVHAIAHQFGGYYNLPHGVCNAILLPAVQEYNAMVAADRLKDVAGFMGVDTTGMSDDEGAAAAIAAIRRLAADIDIPKGFEALGAKREDFDILATNALKDACGATNPRQATHAEIVGILEKVF